MVLRGWRETTTAPTTEKMSSVTRSATTLADFVSPSNWRSATVELAARDNTSPPTSSTTERHQCPGEPGGDAAVRPTDPSALLARQLRHDTTLAY
jgi:hypothetical protein